MATAVDPDRDGGPGPASAISRTRPVNEPEMWTPRTVTGSRWVPIASTARVATRYSSSHCAASDTSASALHADASREP